MSDTASTIKIIIAEMQEMNNKMGLPPIKFEKRTEDHTLTVDHNKLFNPDIQVSIKYLQSIAKNFPGYSLEEHWHDYADHPEATFVKVDEESDENYIMYLNRLQYELEEQFEIFNEGLKTKTINRKVNDYRKKLEKEYGRSN